MYCTNCGKQNPDNANICVECGSSIVEQVLPQRRDNSTRVTLAALCFVAVVLFAILAPVFRQAKEGFFVEPCCQNNTKELAIALDLYSNDYDSRLPQADKWCDLAYDYVKNKDAYVCPADRKLKCGYGMNSSLEIVLDDESAADIVMIFESDRGWNAHGGVEAMLNEPRHSVFNIAFMDTHINTIADDERKRLLW